MYFITNRPSRDKINHSLPAELIAKVKEALNLSNIQRIDEVHEWSSIPGNYYGRIIDISQCMISTFYSYPTLVSGPDVVEVECLPPVEIKACKYIEIAPKDLSMSFPVPCLLVNSVLPSVVLEQYACTICIHKHSWVELHPTCFSINPGADRETTLKWLKDVGIEPNKKRLDEMMKVKHEWDRTLGVKEGSFVPVKFRVGSLNENQYASVVQVLEMKHNPDEIMAKCILYVVESNVSNINAPMSGTNLYFAWSDVLFATIDKIQ